MDFLKEWTYTICITLIISVVFSLLTPKGNMGRFFKIILAAFIFLSFIYPLKSSDIDFVFPEFNAEGIDTAQRETYENSIAAQVNQTLEAGGYNSCIINDNIKLKDNEIYITNLTISIPSNYNKEEVKKYIFDCLGINAEVYFIGE